LNILGHPPGTLGTPESHHGRHFGRKKPPKELQNQEKQKPRKPLKNLGFSMIFDGFYGSGVLFFMSFSKKLSKSTFTIEFSGKN